MILKIIVRENKISYADRQKDTKGHLIGLTTIYELIIFSMIFALYEKESETKS